MKKTTYSKRFTGYAISRDTASSAYHIESMPTKLNPPVFLYEDKEDAASEGKPVKVKVTYTVTVEPVK